MTRFEPGRGQGVGLPRRGLGGFSQCRCPKCGSVMQHRRDIPCNQLRCSECGNLMIGN